MFEADINTCSRISLTAIGGNVGVADIVQAFISVEVIEIAKVLEDHRLDLLVRLPAPRDNDEPLSQSLKFHSSTVPAACSQCTEQPFKVLMIVRLDEQVCEGQVFEEVTDQLKVLIGAFALEIVQVEVRRDHVATGEGHVHRVVEQAVRKLIVEFEGQAERLIKEVTLACLRVANA